MIIDCLAEFQLSIDGGVHSSTFIEYRHEILSLEVLPFGTLNSFLAQLCL